MKIILSRADERTHEESRVFPEAPGSSRRSSGVASAKHWHGRPVHHRGRHQVPVEPFVGSNFRFDRGEPSTEKIAAFIIHQKHQKKVNYKNKIEEASQGMSRHVLDRVPDKRVFVLLWVP